MYFYGNEVTPPSAACLFSAIKGGNANGEGVIRMRFLTPDIRPSVQGGYFRRA
jgi:hypothetical protein